eukprot:gene18005-biopygen18582
MTRLARSRWYRPPASCHPKDLVEEQHAYNLLDAQYGSLSYFVAPQALSNDSSVSGFQGASLTASASGHVLQVSGMPYKKPTHFWTNAPITALKLCDPENPCDFKRRHGRHEKMAQSGSASRESGEHRPCMGAGWHVYDIPAALLKQLFSSLLMKQPVEFISVVCEYLAEMLRRDENENEIHDERVCAHLEEADEEPVILMPEYRSYATAGDVR